MQTHISPGNMKLKNIPNVSLTPCVTCADNAPCKNKCYAMKAFRMYPSVKKAWNENTEIAKSNPVKYFDDIVDYLLRKRPKYFRWHVAGDIPNQSYLGMMKHIARLFPNTRFLAFTKKHDLEFSDIPGNLQIVYSLWPEWGSKKVGMPAAYMQDGKENRVNGTEIICPGSCADCKVCWHLSEIGKDVVFNVH